MADKIIVNVIAHRENKMQSDIQFPLYTYIVFLYVLVVTLHKKTFVHQLIILKKNSNFQKCKSHEME